MTTKVLQIVQAQLIHLGIAKSILIKSWPYLAIIVAHVIWGANFIAAKFALQEFPPMSLAFLRFFLALILLSPFLLTEKRKINKVDLPVLIGIGLLMVTLNIGFFYEGLQRTSVTTASILTLIIPILSVLGGWWFLKEKVYVVNLAGIILGFIGTVLIVGLPFIILGIQPTSQSLLGNILIILASISWVAGAILSKGILQKYSTLTLTAVIFTVGAVTFFIPAVNEYLQNPAWYQQITVLGILSLSFITIGSSICAYFLFEWGLSKLGVIKADLFQYIEPVIATSLAMLILNEQLRFSFIIGAVMIALGVYWATLGKDQHRHHKAHRH
ncbi:MAG: EamA family transporter [Candidatus Daviesbacteria bacterium]|nr:EamA family transporter [Candidatus Daviesbacteria bacterium]